jgi:hypothetical protein
MATKIKKNILPSKFDKVKIGSPSYDVDLYDSNHEHVDEKIKEVGFKIIKDVATNAAIAVTQYTEKVISKECADDPLCIYKKLEKIVTDKAKKSFKTFAEWADFIPAKILESLKDYVDDNTFIKNQDKRDRAKTFVAHISRLPKSKGKFYRGLTFYSKSAFTKFMSKFKVNSIHKIDHISSVSKKKAVAEAFADAKNGVLLNIKAKSVRYINEINTFDEEEGLLLKGTKLKVDKIIKSDNVYKYTEIFLTEV